MMPLTLGRCLVLALVLPFLAGGCAAPAGSPNSPAGIIEVADEPQWRSIISQEDEDRLDRLAEAWKAALDEAREKRFEGAIKAEGELLEPDAALPRPSPSPGSYRCRMIKLGTQNGSGGAFNAYKPFFCYVEAEGDLLTIIKQTGSQRPAGFLYPDTEEKQLIFLGTLALGSEETPLAYRENPDRDMVGVMQRVAPFRYRLVIPWPRYESKLDVIELVPVTSATP
jgi:hypothetical protein